MPRRLTCSSASTIMQPIQPRAARRFIPAVTSEFCFIDNAEDQKFIDSESDLRAEARAQFNAIEYYFTQVEY